MKRFLPACLLLILMALPCLAADYDLKGVWVSTVYNLDYPSKTGLSAEQLKAEADAIIENASAWGLNTIFLQVRPSGDALYQSDIYPWSVWLSGTQGQAADGGFDPLAYFIERAHGLEIEVHAWINPYRITRSAKDTREEAFAALSDGHPARNLEAAVVYHSDGCLYFDPGRPESRALIVEGIMEILDRYAVDGIHMDDYFYPAGQFDDDETYSLYGQGYASAGDFRRASVTQLIQALSARIKARNPYVTFGVSPFGIWANDSQHPEGSATRGDSSYFSHYADTKSWVLDALVDYIMPQLYWQIGSAEADFDTLIRWWSDVCAGTGVDLYIGLAAYRVTEAGEDSAWYDAAEIICQFERMEQSTVSGICLFRYASLAGHEAMAAFAEGYFAQPVERYLLPHRLPADQLTLLEPTQPVQVRAGQGLPMSFDGPLGIALNVLLDGHANAAIRSPEGLYTASALAAESDEPLRISVPTALWEQSGVVCARLLPVEAQVVQTGELVALTRIFSGEADDGGHRVDFYVDSPVIGDVKKTGTAIELTLAPCRMAVLFEDDFFEVIDMTQAGDLCRYTLLLPVDKADWRCRLDWSIDQVSLIVEPDNS